MKSFRERNPDLDMNDLENNPHIPKDVLAVLNGALSLDRDEEEALIGVAAENAPPVDVGPVDAYLEPISDIEAYIMESVGPSGKAKKKGVVRKKGGNTRYHSDMSDYDGLDDYDSDEEREKRRRRRAQDMKRRWKLRTGNGQEKRMSVSGGGGLTEMQKLRNKLYKQNSRLKKEGKLPNQKILITMDDLKQFQEQQRAKEEAAAALQVSGERKMFSRPRG